MKRLLPVILFAAACGVLVWVTAKFTNWINGLPFVTYPADAQAEAAMNNAYAAYASVNQLLTGLATGLLAALGLFLTNGPKQFSRGRTLWLAAASALCVCVSIYWGYISSQNLEWAIEASIPTLDLPKLQWPRIVQFYAILSGVFFFAVFLMLDLTREDSTDVSGT